MPECQSYKNANYVCAAILFLDLLQLYEFREPLMSFVFLYRVLR
jgi:hypothetical protein